MGFFWVRVWPEDDGGRPDSGFGWRFLGRHEHFDECSWGVREKWGGFLFVFFGSLMSLRGKFFCLCFIPAQNGAFKGEGMERVILTRARHRLGRPTQSPFVGS